MTKIIIRISAVLCLLFGMAAQAEQPAEITVEGTTLVKKGEGVRKLLMYPLYDIGLYVPKGDTEGSLGSDQPAALRIEVRSGKVTTARFTEVVLKGFKKYEHYDEVADSVHDYLDSFIYELKEGDVYTVFYKPELGTLTLRSDEEIARVTGNSFREGMFGIWLGERPVNRKLKRKLLGG